MSSKKPKSVSPGSVPGVVNPKGRPVLLQARIRCFESQVNLVSGTGVTAVSPIEIRWQDVIFFAGITTNYKINRTTYYNRKDFRSQVSSCRLSGLTAGVPGSTIPPLEPNHPPALHQNADSNPVPPFDLPHHPRHLMIFARCSHSSEALPPSTPAFRERLATSSARLRLVASS